MFHESVSLASADWKREFWAPHVIRTMDKQLKSAMTDFFDRVQFEILVLVLH